MENKRLFNELMNFAPEHDYNFIRQRAENAIANCTYVMELIENNFDDETAKDLCNRLLLSVKNQNPAKFTRKIQEISKKERNK